MMLDEIGALLKGLRQPTSVMAEIPRMLTKLFSSTDRPEIKAYADGRVIRVAYHHASIYGATTPDNFWGNITYGEVADGFLARVLVFESHHEAPCPKPIIAFCTSPSLEKQINDICGQPPKMDISAGNLMAKPVPTMITRAHNSRGFFDEWVVLVSTMT